MDHFFRQQCSVGQQFHFCAGFGSQTDHFEDVLMEHWFAHTTEEDGLHTLGHGCQNLLIVFQTQIAEGLVEPGMTEAHFAV